MKFLCDTNVISEVVRREPNPGVVAWLERQPAIALSVVTVEEVLYGLAWKPHPKVQRWFDDFVEALCTVLPIDEEIARRSGELRGASQARGEPRSAADMLIAATAQLHQLTLATRNVRHFEGCGIPLLNPFS
jgi:toxin FitB